MGQTWVRVRNKETGQQKTLSSGVASLLRDKYEIIGENVEQKDEQIASDVEAIKEVAPNVEAAPQKSVEVAADDELEKARKRYEELYGGKPHGRTRLETLLKLIVEKENAG